MFSDSLIKKAWTLRGQPPPQTYAEMLWFTDDMVNLERR